MSNLLQGQLSFEGRVVSGVRFALKPMGMEELPDGMTWEDIAGLAPGDYLEATVRIRVLPSSGVEKVDLDSGVGIGSLVKVVNLQPLRGGFKINAILKDDDIEAAWEAAHSA
jgi:hypothetical protein